MRNIFVILVSLICIMFLSSKVFNSSLAYSYDVDKSVLFYKDDYQELADDMKIYISEMDNYIIPNSSFLYSDKLVENYDFLVRFAIDYVLNHKEYYYDSIKGMDTCLYVNKEGMERETTDYISVEKIYEIIDFYFGVRDFSIINEDVCLIDNYISLSDYTDREFSFNIGDVLIQGDNYNIKVLVSYDNDNQYLYSFNNNNNILKVENVEVIR